jgi:hypothetical protein
VPRSLDLEAIRRKESALSTLLGMMDIPSYRLEKKDWRWFLRNLGTREHNREHPMFETTMSMLKWMVRNGSGKSND